MLAEPAVILDERTIRVGALALDPRLSPGVLDTATWDRAAAAAQLRAVDGAYWPLLRAAVRTGLRPSQRDDVTPFAPSAAWVDGVAACLAALPDGQRVFLVFAAQTLPAGGAPLVSLPLPDGETLAAYAADAATIDAFTRAFAPQAGPVALGPMPRLGVGTRMTTAVWPAIWEAMRRGGFATNAIQNSVRELNFLSTLLEAQPAEKNIAFGFGTIETGYTGSSYEGLWVAGVLHALERGAPGPYGADADHIQVKRGSDGLARAKRLLDATRYYSFYTLDVSDVLDYAVMRPGATAPDPTHGADWLLFHRAPRRIGGFDYRPDDEMLARLAAKYAAALDATTALHDYIRGFKNGVPFDLELSIDEHPNDVPTFECLTTETELIFVLLEAQRRGIPLTHVAPNFGVEKGTDYRGADGLPGFEARCRSLWQICEALGVMADFHSGDDLSAASRQAIGRATLGRSHFKVSPNVQLLFGEVLEGHHGDLFRRWWDDALTYAQREAGNGSEFAAACIAKSDLAAPSAHDDVFHHFSFAFVGRRDARGQFSVREEFYKLSPAFYAAYTDRIVDYLMELARDLRMA
jgi:hypothetical protein